MGKTKTVKEKFLCWEQMQQKPRDESELGSMCSRSKIVIIKGQSLAWENLGIRSGRIKAENPGKGLDSKRAQHSPRKTQEIGWTV